MDKALSLKPANTSPTWMPWMMLPARTVLFAAFQALFAIGYLLAGSAYAWDASAAWWPFTVTITNLVCVALLVHLFRREGQRYLELFRFNRKTVKNDLLVLLGILIVTAPVAMLPNLLLAKWLFGNTSRAMSLFIRHLPAWAATSAFILFPVTQGLAELVTYFLYIEPSIEAQTGIKWLAISLAALALSIQHVAIPLVFDGRFMLWRMLMFIPFAFFLGLLLRWRPRLLPYLAIVHILLDMGTAAMLLTV